jgi:magnesium transporter
MSTKTINVCNEVIWIDVLNPGISEMEELAAQYQLNPNIVRDCLQPEHLPKYEFVDDVHFLILRFFSHLPDIKMLTVQDMTNKIAIFSAEHFLITIHRSEAHFLDIVCKKYVANNRCNSTSQLLAHLVWHSLETYDEPVNRLSEQVDFFETRIIIKNSGSEHLESLYMIKREASLGQKVLMLMLEPINHIYIKSGEESLLQDVRDQHLKMQTMYTQVLDNVNHLLNLSMSFASQRTNEVMKVLTIFSAFFLPLTFIVGIYGMNFDYMPELRAKWGYPATLILMAVVTISIFFWFKRKKWL